MVIVYNINMLYVQYPTWLQPEIFSSLPIRWYGLMYVLSFLTGYAFILSQIKKEKNHALAEQLPNIFMWAFIGMLLGARLMSELVYNRNPAIFIHPWELVWPFRGGKFVGLQGMSYHGGLLGIVIATIIYFKVYKLELAKFADKISMGGALGYTFGRIGNFTNGELYGRITSKPWGMIFPSAESLPIADPRVEEIASKVGLEANPLGLINLPRHPSQLYEAFFEGIFAFAILFTLYRLISPTKKYVPGMFFPIYTMLYATARFIIEYFRQPDFGLDFVLSFSDEPNPDWALVSLVNFTTGQILSMIMFLFGAIVLGALYFVRYKKLQKERISIQQK